VEGSKPECGQTESLSPSPGGGRAPEPGKLELLSGAPRAGSRTTRLLGGIHFPPLELLTPSSPPWPTGEGGAGSTCGLDGVCPGACAAPLPRGSGFPAAAQPPQTPQPGCSPKARGGGGTLWRTGRPAHAGRDAAEPWPAVCPVGSAGTLFREKVFPSKFALPAPVFAHTPLARSPR
jgi:hypothetical protein